MTEGGNIHDLTVADHYGTELLIEKMENNEYDSYFIHLVGIDHAGHREAWKDQKLFDLTVDSINDKLSKILNFVKESEEKYTVIFFGDHG